MFHRRMHRHPLAIVLAIVLLLFAGHAVQRNAWTEGYMAGQVATMGRSEEGVPMAPMVGPMSPYRHGGYGMPHRLPIVGLLALAIGAAIVLGVCRHRYDGMDPETVRARAKAFHKRHPRWAPRHAEMWREFQRWHEMCEADDDSPAAKETEPFAPEADER